MQTLHTAYPRGAFRVEGCHVCTSLGGWLFGEFHHGRRTGQGSEVRERADATNKSILPKQILLKLLHMLLQKPHRMHKQSNVPAVLKPSILLACNWITAEQKWYKRQYRFLVDVTKQRFGNTRHFGSSPLPL